MTFGRPSQWLSDLEPWAAPNYIPGTPHNLSQVPLSSAQLRAAGAPTPTPEQAASTYRAEVRNLGVIQDIRENYRYASLLSISLTIGTSSFKFLDAPIGKRNFLGFRNPSTSANIYIDFASQASTNSWLKLAPGVLVVFDTVVSQDDLYVISDTASTPFSYAYSTFPG